MKDESLSCNEYEEEAMRIIVHIWYSSEDLGYSKAVVRALAIEVVRKEIFSYEWLEYCSSSILVHTRQHELRSSMRKELKSEFM